MFALKNERRGALAVVLVCFSIATADVPRWATVLLAACAGALVALLGVGAEDLPALRPAGLAPTRRSAVTTEGGA